MPGVLMERAAVVALLRSGRVSWPELASELLDTGSALAMLREPEGQQELFTTQTEHLLRDAADEVEAWQGGGIGVHTILDESYPALLRDIREAPPILFTRGELAQDTDAIAVVGSRKASERGREVAAAIAAGLAAREITVVSGLAEGIDTAAHEAALAAGGRTVAVIGTGVDRCYPAGNRALQDRIAKEGLVISQFFPDAPPRREHFPMRNVVMSGYSAATVVVEAGERSGVRIQTRLALKHGREVILRRDLLDLAWARDLAAKPGVHVVTSMTELMEAVRSVLSARRAHLDPTEDFAGLLV